MTFGPEEKGRTCSRNISKAPTAPSLKPEHPRLDTAQKCSGSGPFLQFLKWEFMNSWANGIDMDEFFIHLALPGASHQIRPGKARVGTISWPFIIVNRSGWWLTYPSEKMMEWKSVGITIPDIWKHKIHVPNHQPEVIYKYKTPMNGPPMFVVKSKSVREKSGPPAGPPTDQPSCASEEDLEIFRKLLTSRLCENSAEGPICGSFQWEKPEEMCVATSKKMEKYINYQRC